MSYSQYSLLTALADVFPSSSFQVFTGRCAIILRIVITSSELIALLPSASALLRPTELMVDEHYRKFPGTSGSVNLGVDSFGEDLIRDGRIQIVDNAEGCLVLMDDQEPGKENGLYHYRLFCGDNELRTKSYLKVYPNEAVTNSSNSMQLAYYLGTGTQTKDIFTDDEDNIRSPYRQMEKYFDFQIDDPTHRQAYSVKPNFRNSTTGQMDVYGEKTAASEVWYYPAPLDKDGKEIKDVSYGFSELRFLVHPNNIGKFQKWAGSELLGAMHHNDPDTGVYWLYDKDFIDDNAWQDVIDGEDLYLDGTFNIKKATYEKSTLVKALLGLHPAQSGSITRNVTGIGYLPQQTVVQKDFPASVREIVRSGCLGKCGFRPFYTKAERERAEQNMERLGITALARRCYRELSGGQQQRVLLARALCAADSMLLLDEPVTGLDPKAQIDLYELIAKLNRGGVTIIMVSHDVHAAVRYASHILHIGGQTQRFFGTAAEYRGSETGRTFLAAGGAEYE